MIGDIDSTIPVGITHIIDRVDNVCQQHGGVVTAVQFDKLEEMTLDKFISEIVPTMQANNDKFIVIKDTVRQNMYRILKDNVAIYQIGSFTEGSVSNKKVNCWKAKLSITSEHANQQPRRMARETRHTTGSSIIP